MSTYHDFWSDCEIRDYVGGPGYFVVRHQNEAANAELRRRGQSPAVLPSGEVQPYFIVWVDTCGDEDLEIEDVEIETPRPPVPTGYGYGAGPYGSGPFGGIQ